ncbi:hypothetical protein [Vibrio sp. WXL210]|uniref:hypothetical protein n=1 Tax=Vibrio sp. WXL210 TaxID=3450709 RepID=UPI003EC6821A
MNDKGWKIFVEENEELLTPYSETRSLEQLLKYLDSTGQRTFGAVIVHAYSYKGKRYFDSNGYSSFVHHGSQLQIKGGPIYRYLGGFRSQNLFRIVAVRSGQGAYFRKYRRSMRNDYFNNCFGINHTVGCLIVNIPGDHYDPNVSVRLSESNLIKYGLLNRGEW